MTDLKNKIDDLAKDHPAFFITAIFMVINLIGILYSFFLLISNNVNFFDFAETPDFVIGAFRNPLLILYLAIASSMMALLFYKLPAGNFRDYFTIIIASVLYIFLPSLVGFVEGKYPDLFYFLTSEYDQVTYINGDRDSPTVSHLSEVRLVSNVGDFLIFAEKEGDLHIVRRANVVRIFEPHR